MYNAYRAWVYRHGLDHQTVKDSSKSWIAYLFDSPILIGKRFRKSDLSVVSFTQDETGRMVLEIGVDGVTIGDAATADNLARVLGLEGATSLTGGSFSPDNVSFTFGAPINGRATVIAGPRDDTAPAFFMRATMRDLYGDIPVVSFNLNGGETLGGASGEKLVDCDSEYGVLPTPTRAGYTFAGWYTEATGGTKITGSSTIVVNSSHTLYARWTPLTYTVFFDPNGGTVSPTEKSVAYGSAYGALPTPTRVDYMFDGWFTEANGGAQVTAEDMVAITSTQTLYAH